MANPPSGSYILSGVEAQRLRTFCTSQSWTESDLDQYARLLQNGPLDAVRANFQARVDKDGIEQARTSLSTIAYGPTKIPLYNYILQLVFLAPQKRALCLGYFRFLALEAKVPVDSGDLSGTTTLMYSISTKPYLELEIADILLEAGANINHRNRYGCSAAHDVVMARDFTPAGKKKTLDALKYYLGKGGDPDATEGNGVSLKSIAAKVQPLIPEMILLLNGESTQAPSVSPAATSTVGTKKIGRNGPCACGSKRKYKVCCGKN